MMTGRSRSKRKAKPQSERRTAPPARRALLHARTARRIRAVRGRFRHRPGCLLPRRRHRSALHHLEARGAALQLAGQMLRESVLGLMDLNQEPQRIPQSLPHLRAAADDGPESPLNFSQGVDEALVRLLDHPVDPRGLGRGDTRQFPRTQGAEYCVLGRHARRIRGIPRAASTRRNWRRDSSGPAKRGVFGAQNKAKYWDLYSEMFAGLAQRPADGFPHVFTETFARAYEANCNALIPPRRLASARTAATADRSGTASRRRSSA